jgi:ribosomal protein S27AE
VTTAAEYVRLCDEGEERSDFFCPRCGATVYHFVWEKRMHPWVDMPDGIERIDHIG